MGRCVRYDSKATATSYYSREPRILSDACIESERSSLLAIAKAVVKCK